MPPPAIRAVLSIAYNSNGTVTLSTAGTRVGHKAKFTFYKISWGDGGVDVGVTPPPTLTHVYKTSGTYTATLEVTDSKGSMGRVSASFFSHIIAPPTPNTDTTGGGGGSLATPTLSTSVSTDDITVSWTNVTGETSFELWRSVNGGAYSLYQTLGADVLAYADNNLADGTYDYKVRAKNTNVAGEFSNIDGETVSVGGIVGDWFVDPALGSDSNPGTEAQPFQTAMAAHDAASAGDIIILEDGSYQVSPGTLYSGELTIMTLTKSGTAGNPITVRARNRHGAIFEGNSEERDAGVLAIGTASYWVFDGIRVRNMAGSGFGFNASGTDMTVRRCWIHDIATNQAADPFGRTGVFSIYNNTIVEQCLIEDIGRIATIQHDHGIYCKDGDGWIIRNNIFRNCGKGWCIQLFDLPMSNGKIINNTFAFACAAPSGHIIVATNLTNWDISNNIAQSPTSNFLYGFSGSHSGCTARNNLTNAGAIWDSAPAGFTNTGNITSTDPQLVDIVAPTYDFETQVGSPARNAGLTLADATVDYDDTARSAPYDIGAYES